MKLPWEQIEELTKYLNDNGLDEIIIETKEGKIAVKRGLKGAVISPVSQGTDVFAQQSSKSANTQQQSSQDSKSYEVKAPMVGTYYASPSPGADPFIKVGSKVNSGDVLCIIEAMKIMNELPSEVSGTVSEILVKDNQTVEYGQVLMKIDP